jgi:signal transduction histidine kinase
MGVLLVLVAITVGLAAVGIGLYEFWSARREHAARVALERSVVGLRDGLGALDEERRTMQTVLSSMEEGVVLVEAGGRISLANEAVRRHLGASPTALGAVLPLGLQEAVRRAAIQRSTASAEVETGTPSRWLRGTAIPVDEDGTVLLVVRDVTEARRLEAVRRDFVANASHELKTPTASIQAAAETIRHAAGEDPSAITRFATQLEREAIRLSRIVSDLLDLSRLETGSDLAEEVSLDQLLKEEQERFDETAAETNVELSVNAEPAPPIRGSARDLTLLLRNLVDNAMRYTRPGGRVDVSLSADDANVMLTVADTGIGIPTRDLPRIFERFYRVDRARSRETGGTGLGLSIVKHVVENHGGTVHVTSELGQGTTFVVRLPTRPT